MSRAPEASSDGSGPASAPGPGDVSSGDGTVPPEEQIFYCDLCGLMFRQHFNLLKHWRASCPEIQYALAPRRDLAMDDEELKALVQSIIQKPREQDEHQQQVSQCCVQNC